MVSNPIPDTFISCVCRYSADEIEKKVSMFRKMLMDKETVSERSGVEKDEFGRPM